MFVCCSVLFLHSCLHNVQVSVLMVNFWFSIKFFSSINLLCQAIALKEIKKLEGICICLLEQRSGLLDFKSQFQRRKSKVLTADIVFCCCIMSLCRTTFVIRYMILWTILTNSLSCLTCSHAWSVVQLYFVLHLSDFEWWIFMRWFIDSHWAWLSFVSQQSVILITE